MFALHWYCSIIVKVSNYLFMKFFEEYDNKWKIVWKTNNKNKNIICLKTKVWGRKLSKLTLLEFSKLEKCVEQL